MNKNTTDRAKGVDLSRLVLLFSGWLKWKMKLGWKLIDSLPMHGGELGNCPQTKYFFETWYCEKTREIRTREI